MNSRITSVAALLGILVASEALAQHQNPNIQGGNEHQALSGESAGLATQDSNTASLAQSLFNSPEGAQCAAEFSYTKGSNDVPKADNAAGASERRAKVNSEAGDNKRGKMPDGYFAGMIHSFVSSVCRAGPKSGGDPYSSKVPPPPPVASPKYIMAGPDRTSTSDGNDGHDALLTYQGHPGLLQIDSTRADDQHIINTYSLMMTLGMIESSGKISVGVDTSKKCGENGENCGSSEAETGLFQVSRNSTAFLEKQSLEALLQEYRADKTKCSTDIFAGNQNSAAPNIDGPVFENDEAFQVAMKTCPALNAEYTAMLIRQTDAHNGPLLRSEVQPKLECTKILAKAYSAARDNAAICSSSQRGQY
jgi:hypothetical protein